jgi:hypothetical protein
MQQGLLSRVGHTHTQGAQTLGMSCPCCCGPDVTLCCRSGYRRFAGSSHTPTHPTGSYFYVCACITMLLHRSSACSTKLCCCCTAVVLTLVFAMVLRLTAIAASDSSRCASWCCGGFCTNHWSTARLSPAAGPVVCWCVCVFMATRYHHASCVLDSALPNCQGSCMLPHPARCGWQCARTWDC